MNGPRFRRADRKRIRNSEWFDADWYLREHPEAGRSGLSPEEHYLLNGVSGLVSPGPDFVGDEYLALNPDVRAARLNPLLHFETYGRKRYRQISFLESPQEKFPAGAVELRREFPDAAPARTRRTAVFAAFSSDGRISDADVLYLKGLREVADRVLFVSSSPVFPEEVEKLSGLVRVAIFSCHGEYDFGSYKRGYFAARELGLLDPSRTGELILANNSCYGPVVPFGRAFETMEGRPCDFWGMTAFEGFGAEHVQSYFLVFRRRVLEHPVFEGFLSGVRRELDRWRVIMHYETRLTPVLVRAGFRADTLVPWQFFRENASRGRLAFPPARPVTLLNRHAMPLLKVKTVRGENDEDPEELRRLVCSLNPELGALIDWKARRESPGAASHEAPRRARLAHRASFAATVDRIRAKVRRGERVDVRFLVSSASMFPARPFFEACRRDPAFRASVCVVPDCRWRESEADMRSCRERLAAFLPPEALFMAEKEDGADWRDVLDGADVVCYSTPYDVSPFPYNPHWSVGRSFLPVHFNYGYFRSVYDRDVMARQNYAYFWKAFFECDATAREYAEHSILRGANAEVVGYVKMDALASARPWPRNGDRKRVLLAPHHSVEGGANDALALSNFQRYSDYFLSLPERHPELDFVFRPHPFLFTVLADPSRWGPDRVGAWIARMRAHANVRWSDEGDYFPAFASCDACVQDCGSFLVEWLYTGKPCCFLLKDPSDVGAKFAPLGRDCLSHCYLACDEAAMEAFLRDVVAGGADPKAAGRDAFRKTVMVNHPHAADAALRSVRRALGMEPA